MPSELLRCLRDGCAGGTAFDNIVNLVVPLLLDFIVFSILVELLLRRREERRWSNAKDLLLSRLFLTVDRLLLQLAPIEERQVVPQSYVFGEVRVDVAFSWRAPPAREMLVEHLALAGTSWQRAGLAVASSAADRLSRVIQAYGGHLDGALLQILVDFETNIETLEADLKAAALLDGHGRPETAVAAADALLSAERLRSNLVARGASSAVPRPTPPDVSEEA